MAHPLYSKSLPHVNKQITVQHLDGRKFYGTLQSVTPDGLYLRPHPVMGTVSSCKKTSDTIQTAEWDNHQKADAQPVFFAPLFFPFAVLAGFTLGFVAGASRAYYPPYPYYRPYPYYW